METEDRVVSDKVVPHGLKRMETAKVATEDRMAAAEVRGLKEA